jgi:Tfp pilus assembly protein PilF
MYCLKKRYLIFIIALILVAIGCGGPEEKKQRFFKKGQKLYAAGDSVKARLEYKNALQIDPKFHLAYHALGIIEFEERNYKKAYKYFSKAVQIDPNHLPSQLQLGKLFLAGKAIERAREKVNLVLSRDRDNPEAQLLDAAVLLADEETEELKIYSKTV